ncbi:yeats-domain-containing protein [Chlamydoabsidia padenii]|nr:yeats-domain-containing protein [Chlamydoabsidia padenii]
MSNKRIKGLSISRPIYYGNTATPITGKKAADSDHTHKWTVLLKGLDNEDLSYYIRKVVFKLHETYPNPLRTVDQPPFELTETGWGEFEIAIKVHFHLATSEKSVILYHHLRLHPYEDDVNGQPWPKDKPVSSLIYDELVFNEPTEAFRDILAKNNALQRNLTIKKSTKDPLSPQFSVQLEQEELDRLDAAQHEVNAQIVHLKKRMAALGNDI